MRVSFVRLPRDGFFTLSLLHEEDPFFVWLRLMLEARSCLLFCSRFLLETTRRFSLTFSKSPLLGVCSLWMFSKDSFGVFLRVGSGVVETSLVFVDDVFRAPADADLLLLGRLERFCLFSGFLDSIFLDFGRGTSTPSSAKGSKSSMGAFVAETTGNTHATCVASFRRGLVSLVLGANIIFVVVARLYIYFPGRACLRS